MIIDFYLVCPMQKYGGYKMDKKEKINSVFGENLILERLSKSIKNSVLRISPLEKSGDYSRVSYQGYRLTFEKL